MIVMTPSIVGRKISLIMRPLPDHRSIRRLCEVSIRISPSRARTLAFMLKNAQ